MNVVLIEDHDNLRTVLTRTLEEADFNVVALSCAEEMDEIPGLRPAAAYVIDLNLPGEDGISLVKRIRETEPSAYIVITTARTEIHDRIVGYESGSNVYLRKPVDAQELIALLKAHFCRVQQRSTLTQGYQLDTQSRILHGPSGEVKLTHVETRVLAALSGARGRSLESWQLLAQLSPKADKGSVESLQVRLSLLRRKFREVGAKDEIICSERGIGYTLHAEVQIQ